MLQNVRRSEENTRAQENIEEHGRAGDEAKLPLQYHFLFTCMDVWAVDGGVTDHWIRHVPAPHYIRKLFLLHVI